MAFPWLLAALAGHWTCGDARGEIDGGVPAAAIEGVKGALDGAPNANLIGLI